MIKEIKKILKIIRFFLLYRKKHVDLKYEISYNDVIDIKSQVIKDKHIPKKIWMYWDSLDIPLYIQKIIQKTKLMNPDYELILLNKLTVFEYLKDLDFYDNISLAHKADIIRLKLLYEYGGIWIDTSTIFYKDLSWLNELLDNHNNTNYDCIGYFRDVSTVDRDFPIIENWFLCAPVNNEFIKKWFEILLPLKDLGPDKYFQEISKRSDYDILKQKITTPSYLLAYLAQQIVLRQTDQKYSFYLKKCENDAFYYQERFNWSTDEMTNLLTQVKKPEIFPPLIKLTNYDRAYLNFIIEHKLYVKDSIIYQLLEQV